MSDSLFTTESVEFLKSIREHNHKRWFEEHRHIYQTYLLEPFRALSTRLSPAIFSISEKIETRPQVGKTISRIFRDTRFSHSKLPLRDHLWLEFRDRSRSGADTPQFFFYLEPDEWGYGMGFWQASSGAMAAIRERILAAPERGDKLLRTLKKAGRFELGGEKFSRPRKIELPELTFDLYQHKSFYFISRQAIKRKLFSGGLAEEVAGAFKLLGPIYRYVVGI
ncbi:MAG TPA: DUF2461 domain-containing protein [bacterium]|jgi:uncharacterized protein (TIGR02453 family)